MPLLFQAGEVRLSSPARATFAVCLVTLALIFGACKSEYPAGGQQKPPGGDARAGGEAREVKVGHVAETPVGAGVSVTGTLAAQDEATLSVKVPGRISSVTVDLGSVVRRGQVIAQVEQADYKLRVQQAGDALQQVRARLGLTLEGSDDRVDPEQTGTVRQARAVLDEASQNRKRILTLVEQGVVARAEFESADSAFKVAQSKYQDAVEEIRNRQGLFAQRRTELALARQALADTTIVASFDGIVQEKRARVGEFLSAGAPVVTIVRVRPLRFRAEVAERSPTWRRATPRPFVRAKPCASLSRATADSTPATSSVSARPSINRTACL